MHDTDAPQGEFYFNPSTREVEEGKVSPWAERMGPYRTRQEAEQALAKAETRSNAWDEEDRRWREE